MYIKIDDDTVLCGSTWIRRSPTSEAWQKYEAWVADGNTASTGFRADEWNRLPANTKRRMRELKP